MFTIDLTQNDPFGKEWILRTGESAAASIKKMMDSQGNVSFNDYKSIASGIKSLKIQSPT
jgi:hypothetical protein